MFTHFSQLFALSAGRQSAHNNPPSRITEIRQSLNGFYTPLTGTCLQKPNFFKGIFKVLKTFKSSSKREWLQKKKKMAAVWMNF